MKMQQDQRKCKQQSAQEQQQQYKHLSSASGQNAFSRSRQSAYIQRKLAANKQASSSAEAREGFRAATGTIRSIRFRTQICNDQSNNNKSKKQFSTSKARAQDTFGANGVSRRHGDDVSAGSENAATEATQPPTSLQQLPQGRASYYELKCRINYGAFQQVHVQFHSSNRQCCAFSWKSKFRHCNSFNPKRCQFARRRCKRQRQLKKQKRWSAQVPSIGCPKLSRHSSLLSSSSATETEESGGFEVEVENTKETVVRATGSAVYEVNDSHDANVALVATGDEIISHAKSNNTTPATEALALANFCERALELSIASDKTITTCASDEHKTTVVIADATADETDVDLIDFIGIVEPATASKTSIIGNVVTPDAAAAVDRPNLKADTQLAAGDTIQISADDMRPTLLMLATEVSGDLLFVGDCKGVAVAKKNAEKKKAKQVEALNECKKCANEQLTAEGSGGSDQNRASGGNAATKNAKHTTDTPTELHEINHNNNNSITTTTATTLTNGTTTTATRTNSPILGHHGKKTTTTTTTTASTVVGVTGAAAGVVGGTLLEKKSQAKFLSTRGKALLQKSHQQQRSAEDAAPVSATSATERLDATELQRLKYLNRHSCNGRLDYEAIERHLQQTELQEEQRNKSIEVLGVLLQYAVHDLDAFACPRIKAEKAKVQNYLTTTLKLLDEAKTSCTQLQDQLCDKEGYYSQREEDLQALHRCEMEKAQASLCDYQAFAQQKILTLESQLDAQTLTHKRTLDSYRLEMDNKLTQKQQQLDAAEERERSLKDRFSALEISEQELRDKLTSTENAYAARLQAATEREHTLNERVKTLSREIDALRTSKEHRERELRDKLHLSQDEISVLRSSQRSFNESLDRSSGFSSPRNSSTSELARLQSEADSLHCVLELKQKEISKLTKHNEELMRDAEERAVLQGKISLLESNNEMLKTELDIKSEKEKDFLRQMNDMQKAYNHEATKRKRLSYDNEQLQWQLKQRSEQLHIVETKLHELSAVDSINASNQSSLGSLHRSQLLNGSSLINIQMEDISPPTSPVVKGVIEKPDSVSWVLEMDDETPEAAASKMVKRAGSFRSVERSPSTRRQLSSCSSAINTSLNSVGSANGHNNTIGGPNPLSQSMSATSVIRQHSSDGRHEFPNSRAHSRIRSKSVSVKSSEPPQAGSGTALNTGSVGAKSGKRLLRQSSSSNARKQHQLELVNWKEPISSSSPHPMRARTSTMCSEVSAAEKHDDTLFQRTPTSSAGSRKLITCDTSKLNSGERLDMQSLPTHASVHDLKKKFHEIQESAGEAMVSGTNSEDEGCSASSDEIVCSVSTSSATTGSTSSLKNSLEEVLLLEKINSLNGTPMEVSWSDDPEIFTNGSTV